MLNPQDYPAEEFYAAWRNAILYDEHTWGAKAVANALREEGMEIIYMEMVTPEKVVEAAVQVGPDSALVCSNGEMVPRAILDNTCIEPHVLVDHPLRSGNDLPLNRDDVLRPETLGLTVRQVISFRIEHNLSEPPPVSEIYKDKSAMIPPSVHPSHENYFLADIFPGQ